jgi:hypothetical protein
MTMSRDYRAEYDNYHASPTQKRRRAKRNAARRKMTRAGKVRKGDKKDVHHVSGMSNRSSNLRVLPRGVNRSIK